MPRNPTPPANLDDIYPLTPPTLSSSLSLDFFRGIIGKHRVYVSSLTFPFIVKGITGIAWGGWWKYTKYIPNESNLMLIPL